MAHVNATINSNKTISRGSVAHVGQLYFDQDLITEVEKSAPYNTNKQFLVLNKYDFLMYQAAGGIADPVVEYVMLGPKIEDGLFGFVNFGIDSKRKTTTIREAAACSESGCVAKAGFGPPPGGFPPFDLGALGALFGFGKPAGGVPKGGAPNGGAKGVPPY
jgi:hypothetical protein